MLDVEGPDRGRASTHSRRPHRKRRGAIATALVALLLIGATPVAADEYESDRSGHPLRILAYVVYPVGFILDTLIFRPFHWLGSHQPFKAVHGHED